MFLGSCANAKYDLAVVADILKGRRIHPDVRFIITPGSKIMLEAMRTGVLATLVESGGTLQTPGCGACAGDGGILADGEVCLSTANRNFGRMVPGRRPQSRERFRIRGSLHAPRKGLQIRR